MKRTTLSLPRFGTGPSLHRVQALAGLAGVELQALGTRSIVIVGSNGKGSVATLLAASLESQGQRVGLFTSPHFLEFNERFRTNGQPISDEALMQVETRVGELITAYERDHPGDHVGEFEAWFLVAAIWFQEQGCETCVFEAGIGGRLDPTRLLRAPLAVLTSIDLEHTELLGETLREIAYDKLEVVPEGADVILGELPAGEVGAIGAFCKMRGLGVQRATDAVDITLTSSGSGGRECTATFTDGPQLVFKVKLRGPFLKSNLSMALAAYARWRDLKGLPLEANGLAEQLSRATFPGRFEWLDIGPGVLIDAAHTPAALENVTTSLDGEFVLLFGTSDTAKTDQMLDVAARHFDVAVIGQTTRGVDPRVLKLGLLKRSQEMDILAEPNVGRAVAAALALGEAEGRPVAVLGGLFWAAAVRAVLLGESGDGGVDFS